MSFATHPMWVFNYLTHGKFKLANVQYKGTNIESVRNILIENNYEDLEENRHELQ